MRKTALLTLLLLRFMPALSAAEPPAAPPVVTAGMITSPIVLDGALNEPAWASAGVISNLTQQEPFPGQPTPYDTKVMVLADRETLYIGVACSDPEPERIAVHTLQRDANLSADDTVAVVLDTFGDARTGYIFRINAAGARQDGLLANSADLSYDWDGIWDARTRRTATGWTAEIAISARTLRFRHGLGHWGFNVERTVARSRLTLRWAGVTHDASFTDLRRAGQLAGLGELRQGLGLTAVPYGLSRYDHQREPPLDHHGGNAGLDLGYNLTPELAECSRSIPTSPKPRWTRSRSISPAFHSSSRKSGASSSRARTFSISPTGSARASCRSIRAGWAWSTAPSCRSTRG